MRWRSPSWRVWWEFGRWCGGFWSRRRNWCSRCWSAGPGVVRIERRASTMSGFYWRKTKSGIHEDLTAVWQERRFIYISLSLCILLEPRAAYLLSYYDYCRKPALHPGNNGERRTTKPSANGHASLMAWAEMGELSRYVWILPARPLQVRNATISEVGKYWVESGRVPSCSPDRFAQSTSTPTPYECRHDQPWKTCRQPEPELVAVLGCRIGPDM